MIKKVEVADYVVYLLNGEPHRPNGPAVLSNNGNWYWYMYNEDHRYYGSCSSWRESWCIHGKCVK